MLVLALLHEVEQDFIRVHAYHTVREGLVSSNRRGKVAVVSRRWIVLVSVLE